MTRTALLAAVLAAAPTVGAAADEADVAAPGSIVQQLRCVTDPDALPAIAYFAKRRFIDLDENVGADSVSCYELTRPYDLEGLPVIGVCGSTEDPLVRALWSDVFYRGPGTSPGVLLSVSTSASVAQARDWAEAHGVPGFTVADSDWFDGSVQVECGSLSRF